MCEVHQKARIRNFKKQTFSNARSRIFCVTNEWIRKMNNDKITTDANIPGPIRYSFVNYHFLTRSTDSITRLTSSLARLRVSKRIMPLLFIMAAIAVGRSSRIIYFWIRCGTGSPDPVPKIGEFFADKRFSFWWNYKSIMFGYSKVIAR